ncbi:hypothetical protein [Candidatus Enterococcus clewellii]|uniref:DUF5626 domain-containing protein n=1 Tax=Candidatus Enterococcus clewellii TaxID=1834193 RepID=A0A242K2F6_9ENTE|nr:hypothetical protein [Enterococcus sp. 9E7_DIV0242]OTP12769.1 hypothetical protein A5888_003348 [Enterococcus sp. 9E7_DIV0242]
MKKILFGFILLGTFIAPVHSQAETKPSHYSYTPEMNKVEVKETGEMVRIEIDENSFIELDSAYKDVTVISSNDDPTNNLRSVTYGKTITLTSSVPSFNSTAYYSEYNNTFKRWYAGTLQFRSSKYQGGKYVATYGGILIMQNW